MLKFGFEVAEMKLNFIYKTLLPGSWRWRFPIENEIISFLPYARGSNHKEVHEARDVELSFLLYKHLENTTLDRPLDANHKPSSSSRGALKNTDAHYHGKVDRSSLLLGISLFFQSKTLAS